MLREDFERYGIVNFSWDEAAATGADPRDVNVFWFVAAQKFRTKVDRAVVLLPGGLTTGVHGSWQHPNGTAGDVAFREGEGPLVPKRLVYAAVESGFLGIGVYYNGTALSMHLDLGPLVRRWLWLKAHRRDDWSKYDLITDPYDLYRKEFET
jgi:hypothetical protein